MRYKFLAGLLAVFVLVSCSKREEVSIMNLSEVDRQDELVEVCLCQFKKLDPKKIVVLDSTGKQLPVQLVYKGEKEPQSLVFPVTVKAGRKVVLTIQEGKTINAAQKPVGTILEPSWLERLNGIELIAPYGEDSIWTLGHYDRYKILDAGVFRSSFVLYYDSVRYYSHVLSAEVQVTVDKGSYLNEITVRFSGDTAQIRLATAIAVQDQLPVWNGNPERGYIGYAHPVPSESKNGSMVFSNKGFAGLVFLNRLAEVKAVDGRVACISHYMQGEFFRYFAGTASGKSAFTSDKEWFDYLSNQRKAKSNPLDVRID